MICVYLQAKFAVFRTFSSGTFRPTAGFLTPSAAYGLLLNFAGIEMRLNDGKSEMTLIQKDLPKVKLALGALSFPQRHSVFQQLHNYPIGNSGKEHAPKTKGSKYNIFPARREFLSDVKAYICTDENVELEKKIIEGIQGKQKRMYGLPFLGDNNFLIDRFDLVEEKEPAFWFEKIGQDREEFFDNATRLTISINRSNLSKTTSALFAPTPKKQLEIPVSAWVKIP